MKLRKENHLALFEIKIDGTFTYIPFSFTGKISAIRLYSKPNDGNINLQLKIDTKILTEQNFFRNNISFVNGFSETMVTYTPALPIKFTKGYNLELRQPSHIIEKIILFVSELENETPTPKTKPMDTYILQKDLPDAIAGTKITWNETKQCFQYYRSNISQILSGEFRTKDEITYFYKEDVINNPDWFAKQIVKPPLGLIPYWAHTELRLKDINEAIARREGTQFEIPTEWLAEKSTLTSFINGRIRDKEAEAKAAKEFGYEKKPPVQKNVSEIEDDKKALEMYLKLVALDPSLEISAFYKCFNKIPGILHNTGIPSDVNSMIEYIQTRGRRNRRLQILEGYLSSFSEKLNNGFFKM